MRITRLFNNAKQLEEFGESNRSDWLFEIKLGRIPCARLTTLWSLCFRSVSGSHRITTLRHAPNHVRTSPGLRFARHYNQRLRLLSLRRGWRGTVPHIYNRLKSLKAAASNQ